MTKSEFIKILAEQAKNCRHRDDITSAEIVEFILNMAL